jgi:hypothetical protein
MGHDQESKLMLEDFNWWMRQHNFGLYPRSVQAENIAVVGWLLYSTRDINRASLQRALEARFKNKFEVGCCYRMISLGKRGAVPKDQQIKAIHIECDREVQFELKVLLSRIYALEKNTDYPNSIRMRLVPEINSMISPDTRQNVTRLRARQDNFQQQIVSAITWDISALDFVDPKIGHSLRTLVMMIESRSVKGQPLFHVVDETWNQNGFHFAFFPNVEAEARAMMMALIPFLVHFYDQTATKWFSASVQRRSQGAEWDEDKGCVRTFDDDAVSWYMTEDLFQDFDKAKSPATANASRPDPSNLQKVATGLITDQDYVGTFDPNGKQVAPQPSRLPAQLVTGAKANPAPRILPASTASDTSKSTRSSMTESLFSRISQMEGPLAKVDQLDSLMNRIANHLGILATPAGAPVPPSVAVSADTSPVPVHAQPLPAATVTQLEAPASLLNDEPTTPLPDDGRPLTYVGPSSNPRTLPENWHSLSEQVSADIGMTDVGPAG